MDDLVSICIPSYKRVHYLKRLLDSIALQTYRNFEVIITDDSGDDDSVKELAADYGKQMSIIHKKNFPALGTPRNWMAGIAFAKGDWIKIIHDDDWLAGPDSLQSFVDAAKNNRSASLIFGGYTAVYEETGRQEDRTISQKEFKRILNHPFLLFTQNKLGPPSVLMIHRRVKEYYDTELKWFVDIEYYARMLRQEKAVYIDRPLINMSYNDTQVTNDCFHNPAVEIPEVIHILNRHGSLAVKGWRVYDAWWRTLRNDEVWNPKLLASYANGQPIPGLLLQMAKHLQKVPRRLLRIGFFSKAAVMISYLLNDKQIAASNPKKT